MNIKQIDPIIIFSVFQSNKTEVQNLENHLNVREVLVLRGTPFRIVQGVYKNIHELSFVLENTIPNFVFAKKIATQFNQESILVRDKYEEAQLFMIKDHSIVNLGILSEVNESFAKSQDSYTWDVQNNMYYAIKSRK